MATGRQVYLRVTKPAERRSRRMNSRPDLEQQAMTALAALEEVIGHAIRGILTENCAKGYVFARLRRAALGDAT